MREFAFILSFFVLFFCHTNSAQINKQSSIFTDIKNLIRNNTFLRFINGMSDAKIQHEIDQNYYQIEEIVRLIDDETLSKVIFRIPNLNYNLQGLDITTLGYIYGRVDPKAKQYIFGAAPNAYDNLQRYFKEQERRNCNEGWNRGGGYHFDDDEYPYPYWSQAEQQPHEYYEEQPEWNEHYSPWDEEPMEQYPYHPPQHSDSFMPYQDNFDHYDPDDFGYF